MPSITNLMKKQAASLFPEDADEQDAFLRGLVQSERDRTPAVIRTRGGLVDRQLEEWITEARPDWLPEAISFIVPEARVGELASFEKGEIYSVDQSSVCTASAMLAAGRVRRVLDVCAAPGGKTLFASVVLEPEFLLSNEVIGKRLGILCHNLRKSGRPNLFTQGLDPAELAEEGRGIFDLVIVDAPCSGQSLLAKGADNPGCFHPNIVKGNARRQLRILSRAAECVSSGGFLFYSTCTFSIRENEGVIDKFLGRSEDFTTVEVPHLEFVRSNLTDGFAYRIHPHLGMGAGGFTCLMRKEGQPPDSWPPIPDLFWEYPAESRD